MWNKEERQFPADVMDVVSKAKELDNEARQSKRRRLVHL